MSKYKVGTRRSQLAQWQADQVIEKLSEKFPSDEFEKVFIQTKGDKDQTTDLRKMSGQGVFVKRIQAALLNGEIDFAVHSAKDMPSIEEEGLTIAAAPLAGSEQDSLITCCPLQSLTDLPQGAVIGTSSLRRQFELAHQRPDLVFKAIRGNIDTRLNKLADGQYDAIVMAQTALDRLHIDLNEWSLHSFTLPSELPFISAVGQGIIAVECVKDSQAEKMAASIDQPVVHRKLTAERAFLSVFGVGCNVPIGASACVLPNGNVQLTGIVGDVQTNQFVTATKTGTDSQSVGLALGKELKERSLL